MKTLLGAEGISQGRVIFCVSWRGYYLAVKIRGRYRRHHLVWA